MNPMNAAALAFVASFVLSSILAVVMLPPIRSVLRSTCPTGEGIAFWTRFTILMIFLGPLIVTLVFGVPPSELTSKFSTPDIALKVIKSALVGSFLTLGVIGIRIATLRRNSASAPLPIRKTDDEYIK